MPARAATEPLSLQLEVFLNGQPTKRVGTFSDLGNGRIAATRETLSDLGLKAAELLAPGESVALEDIPGLDYTYDEAMQTIDMRIGDAGRDAHVVDLDVTELRGSVDASDGMGAVVNYGLFAAAGSGSTDDDLAFSGASLLLDSRVYGGYGVFETAGIIATSDLSESNYTRLDTSWSYVDPGLLLSLRAGDLISGGHAWTRPVRIGGVQVQRDFGLRPDLITMPLPSLGGSAVVPSTIDVYVNGTRTYSGSVSGGPFEVTNIPVVTGAGTARVVVRDATGNEQEVTADFYASPLLLRQGLFDYSLETGVLRSGFGGEHDSYGDSPVASASARYGLNNRITLETHAEAGEGLANGGVGMAVGLGSFGVGTLAAAGSTGSAGDGLLLHGSLETLLGPVSLRLASTRSFGDFADLGSLVEAEVDDHDGDAGDTSRALVSGRAVPRAVDQVSIGWQMPENWGAIGLTYLHIDTEGDETMHLISGSYSRGLDHGASLFANAFHDFGDEGNTGVYAGIAFSLGGWASASTGVSHDKDGTAYSASASKALGEAPGSIGWQAGVRQDDQSGGHAAIAYRASKARVEGRVTARGDRATASAALDGSVVAAGGSVFLAQRIDDAFAVVDAGAPDVTVKLENRPVAVTNADGKALVTGLRAHERNKISIDILNLPLDARTETTETHVAPQLRGGVTVDFGVSEEPAAALLVIRRPDGSFVPAGSSGQLASGGEPFFVGYDGQAYVTGLAADNTIILEMPEGACSATFAFTPEPGTQTTIDPVICQ